MATAVQMEEFDFDYHMPTTKYPESGYTVQLGGSYTFAVAPDSPDQRIITLSFDSKAMKYVVDEEGEPDVETDPQINFYRLEQFYQRHKRWKRFKYVHPMYGEIVVTFNKPLETPRSIRGWCDGFSVELLEQP